MLRDEASLLDIYRAGQKVLRYAEGLSRGDLEIEEIKLSAILYQIEVVGEATKRLSQNFRGNHPNIPWSRATGMRDIIAHHYDRLDLDVVWNVIQYGIPELIEMIEPLLPQEPIA